MSYSVSYVYFRTPSGGPAAYAAAQCAAQWRGPMVSVPETQELRSCPSPFTDPALPRTQIKQAHCDILP